MADKSVATKTEEDKRPQASVGVERAQEIIRFLARVFRPDSINGEPSFTDVELEGVGHILEHCEDLLCPTIVEAGHPKG